MHVCMDKCLWRISHLKEFLMEESSVASTLSLEQLMSNFTAIRDFAAPTKTQESS